MKKLIFAAMAVMFLFTSCEKGSEVQPEPQGESAMLNISIQSPAMNRVAGNVLPTDVVENYSVFITDHTGEIIWKTYNGTSEKLENFEVTTNAQDVYIVANAGNITTNITSMQDLNDYIADLNGEGIQATAANRWATGKTESKLEFKQEGEKFTADAKIILRFIAARITVNIINEIEDYNPELNDGSLILEKVAVLNARGASHLFGESLIPEDTKLVSPKFNGKKFYTGIKNPDDPYKFEYFPEDDKCTVTESLLADNITKDSKLNETKFYYYVFENNANTANVFPTIVTIVAKSKGKTIYYPVHLTKNAKWDKEIENGTEFIKRGHSYNITIKLTMKQKPNEDHGGSSDPTLPISNAFVNITVELSDWIPVTLEKTF